MAAYREEEDPFEEDIVFDQAGLLNNTSKINTAIRRVSSGKCVLFAKTLGLCGAFFGLGLCIAIPGPTFLSPLTALEVNVSNIYVARSSGYLIGAIIGGMLFDHFNRLFLLFLSLLLTSVFITVAPWCQVLWLQVACMVTLGITMGFLDTGGNVLCLDLWGRNSGPFMQALHFSFGLGAFVAPLLAVPFLEPAALNATFATDISQIATEYPVHISVPQDAGVLFSDGIERVERDVEGFNDTIINKTQVNAENVLASSSSSFPMLNSPTEVSPSNLSYSETVTNISVTPESEVGGPLSPGTTVSVPNTTVKQKTLKHKPSKTDGSKLGNTNWEGVHVGQPPLADLLPAPTTGTTKLSTVLISSTAPQIASSQFTTISSSSTDEDFQSIHETSSFVPFLSETSDGDMNVAASSPATLDIFVNPTTEKVFASNNSDEANQDEITFHAGDAHSFRNYSDVLTGSKQQLEQLVSVPSSTQPYSSTSLNTMSHNPTSQPSAVDQGLPMLDKELPKSMYSDSSFVSGNKTGISKLEPSQQPLVPLSLKEISSNSSPFSGSQYNSTSSIYGSDFQKFPYSPQNKLVTKGGSVGHDEYYVQNSGTGESLDRNNENAFSDSRILSSDNLLKENNESKTETKVDDLEHAYNPPSEDILPISSKQKITTGNSNSPSEVYPPDNNGSKIIDVETISDRELHLSSLSSTASTIMPERDEITSSLNYINSPGVSKHIHRKPGTFDNDTEHINTIFDVFANRIEKYGFNKLQFSYLIVGIFVFSVSLIFLGFLCHNPRDPKSKQEEGQGSKKIVNKTVHKMLVSLMAFFFFLYMGMEVTYGQLVLAFAMHSNLKLSQPTGSVISVVFWGSFAAMRFASIFFASGFTPLTMLILNFVFCTTGTLLVSALANHVETALWVGTALIGIGLASMFPTGILWIERYIHVSNKVAAIFVIGVSLGQMICPITVYRLMVNNPQMLMHSALVINILCILAFVALWWLASRQGEKYSVVINNGYQLANQNDEEEDMLDMSPSGSAVTFRRHSFSSEHRALLNGNVHRGP